MGRPPLWLDRPIRALPVALAIVMAGCGTAPAETDDQIIDNGQSYFPDAAWRTAAPGRLGLDPDRIAELDRDISAGRYGSIQGVLILRYGYLGFERYRGWTPSTSHTMQSVTKSITSLVYGIAHRDDPAPLAHLDRPVLSVFTSHPTVANVDQRKQALTVGDLLTMRTGMDFWEQPYPGSPLDQLNRSAGDWIQFILDRPMTSDPGTSWAYNSGAAILIGAAVKEDLGEDLTAFARRELFLPIGVTSDQWYRSPFDGTPHTGGGLSLTPSDLARVGYLVLRHGRWGDREVVPRAWLDLSTAWLTRGPPVYFDSFGAGYGYFWWGFPTRPTESDQGIIAASGAGGQWLFVIPALDLVVAIVATDGAGLDLLYRGVLPAVTGCNCGTR